MILYYYWQEKQGRVRIGMGDIVDMILQVNICKESVTYRELGIGIVTTSSMTLYYHTFELTPVEKISKVDVATSLVQFRIV